MAHYRKLQIRDETYRVNIGKSYVEIRSTEGKTLIPKKDVGFEAINGDVVVTPKMIQDFILNQRGFVERYFEQCNGSKCNGKRKLTTCPFAEDMHNKKIYLLLCSQCEYDIAMGK